MKIIIEISGGLVSNVYADGAADIEIFDLDLPIAPEPDEIAETAARAAEFKNIIAKPEIKKIW